MKLLKRTWYWLRCHLSPWSRYHIIKISYPKNGYTWGWADSNTRMLFANFKILADFVEKEKAFECHVDWDSEDNHRQVKKDLLDLYTWWTHGRAEELARIDQMPVPGLQWEPAGHGFKRLKELTGVDREQMDAYSAALDQFEKGENERLAKLISLRHYMWT